MHHILIAYKSFISAPQPFCCNLWAHWVRLWQLLLLPIEAKYHILSLTVSYKQKINKTNTCTTISLSTLAIHFICQRFPIFLPSYPSYNAVQNYHRRSTRNYRSDQIEQNKQLTFYQQISTIPTVLAPVLVASTWTTTTFSTYISFFFLLKSSAATTSHRSFFPLTSYGTIEFQRTVDFLLPYSNNSNGVGTSTSCFYLNCHLHLLPIHFSRHRRQQTLIVTDQFLRIFKFSLFFTLLYCTL